MGRDISWAGEPDNRKLAEKDSVSYFCGSWLASTAQISVQATKDLRLWNNEPK